MKRLFILLIRFYQRFISPLKRRPVCRFSPTCSAYAIEALQKRGLFVGTFLTVYRILRCNPFCPGGYDPVPTHGIRPFTYDETPEEEDVLPPPRTVCPDYIAKSPRRAPQRQTENAKDGTDTDEGDGKKDF